MSVRNINYFKGRPIGIITLLPAPLLTIQGMIDALRSRRETTVIDARIERLAKKCAILKGKEVLAAEELGKEVRKDGIRACNILIEQNGKDSARRTAVEYAKSRVLKVGTFLADLDLVLRTRIGKINDEASAKILAYVKGVRFRVVDYVPSVELGDEAYEGYTEKHAHEDGIIRAAVNRLLTESGDKVAEVTESAV